jgi:protein SCO1/2
MNRHPQRCAIALLLVALVAAAASGAKADAAKVPKPPQAQLLEGVTFEQRLDAQVPMDVELIDDDGHSTTLAECVDDRPAIFVLAYYRCPMLCNQVLVGLARSLRGGSLRPGEDLEVVVVSFDPDDTVEMAAAKKDSVVTAYDRDASGEGWHFLTGEAKVVTQLAESVGFRYAYDQASAQYAHASGIVILTPSGRVSKYFYGIDYPTRDVRLALVEASAGRIGTMVDQLLLYCFHYDPLTGRYGLAIMRVIRAGGVLTVVALAGFVWTALRRERRGQAGAAAAPSDGAGAPPVESR